MQNIIEIHAWADLELHILPNFVYTLILKRSRLGLLHIIFRTFITKLWPLIDVKISFRISFPLLS